MVSANDSKEVIVPMVPVPDQVLFPAIPSPLMIGRERSLSALEDALAGEQRIFFVAQRSHLVLNPVLSDLFPIGVIAEPLQPMRVPDGNVRVVAEGKCRARLLEIVQTEPYSLARVEMIEESVDQNVEVEAWMRSVRGQFEDAVQMGKSIPPEALIVVSNVENAGRLADVVAYYLDVGIEEKQGILETLVPRERLERVAVLLERELKILEIDGEIENRVKEGVGDSQKDFILRERLKAIQEELGERDSVVAEMQELHDGIEAAGLPDSAKEKALKELDRLEKMPPMSPETSVIRTYLDWIISLPWAKSTQDTIDIAKAKSILDEDHYGLKDVKDRVLEFLAVRKLTDKSKGPILCFIGPPGVGKTSVGKSIARSIGREFVRISLGGVRDEAEIRGHRRTYVGALPGQIIQAMKTVAVKNPVFMMDEIDKVGIDFRGDPSAALLEALDPEQNHEFSDHYLELPFDLSEAMFVMTGNVPDTIPPALLDRMEIIDFPGYTEDEKTNIAKHFLIPKGLESHGLKSRHVTIGDSAVDQIVRRYTREAGVRNLDRSFASLFRKVAVKVADKPRSRTSIGTRNLHAYLGPPKFHFTLTEARNEIGLATGLAWTPVGGDIIHIEVTLLEGSGKVTLTGHLGQVMQESAQAAVSYVRALVPRLGVELDFERVDVHIHVPEGATPKDGPSAGVTIATALISSVTRIPVRREVAMTGEITLRGRILPVGSIREKVLAAHRAELKEVVMPSENKKDIHDLPDNVMNELTFHFFDSIEDLLTVSLESEISLMPTQPFPPHHKPAAKAEQPVA